MSAMAKRRIGFPRMDNYNVGLLRVDFIWRVTHRDPKPGQEIQNFAVNLGIKLKF